MDAEVGELLDELEAAGLADDTIVFYYSDHGGALPRGKRNIHDSGTRVPLIVRVPDRWSHLATAEPGAWVDRPVSFVDVVASLLNLAGVPIPEDYDGRPFLGEDARRTARPRLPVSRPDGRAVRHGPGDPRPPPSATCRTTARTAPGASTTRTPSRSCRACGPGTRSTSTAAATRSRPATGSRSRPRNSTRSPPTPSRSATSPTNPIGPTGWPRCGMPSVPNCSRPATPASSPRG